MRAKAQKCRDAQVSKLRVCQLSEVCVVLARWCLTGLTLSLSVCLHVWLFCHPPSQWKDYRLLLRHDRTLWMTVTPV